MWEGIRGFMPIQRKQNIVCDTRIESHIELEGEQLRV